MCEDNQIILNGDMIFNLVVGMFGIKILTRGLWARALVRATISIFLITFTQAYGQ